MKPPDVPPAEQTDAPQQQLIRVRDLAFTYPGQPQPAVAGIDFDVAPGETFGFLGPSGAGKTTTQSVLIGLLRGWGGSVEVMGRSLLEWGSDYYRSIGVSFELPNHYLKLTARENLEYFRALYDGEADEVEEVLELVGLLADVDRPVSQFSKGMKNRLNFARSLIHRPRLWFLDEPTAGLDPTNAVRIREIIRERQAMGVTTVVTTHDMRTAESVCDRVAFIVDGAIAAIDSPEAFRHRYGRAEVEVRWGDGGGGDGGGSGAATFPLHGLADDEAFRSTLRRPELRSIHSLEATLEDVFLEVTGRGLVLARGGRR